MELKVFFVMRAAAHFPYHVSTIDQLVTRGHDVTLLFDPTWKAAGPLTDRALQEWLARTPGVRIEDSLQRRGWWRKVLFVSREVRSYASYCRRGPDVEFYRNRWKKYLPSPLRALADTAVGRMLFGLRFTQRAMGAIERLAPPDRDIVDALRREKPDCVIASPIDMRFSEEVEYVKAARALGIPSVVPVLSWDNLTTKGLFHVRPDVVLAWHEGHRKEAQAIHGISRGSIAVTGSPFFDKWFEAGTRLRSRAETCRRLGVNPARPYVLYLGSSSNIAPDESPVVRELWKALGDADDPAVRRHQLVFKPHPANLRAIPSLDEAAIPVWPREVGLPDTQESVLEFREALHHAAAIVGINTTGMVDALLCDKPTVGLVDDQFRRTQAGTTHFQRMKQSGALYTEASARSVATLVGRLASGDDPRAAARREFMTAYARPCGLGASAGEAAALAIELLTQGNEASHIESEVRRTLRDRPAPRPPDVEPDPQPAETRRTQQPLNILIRKAIADAGRSPVYAHYQRVRDRVLRMMDEETGYAYSDYWDEEAQGFDYLFDASPLVIARLREHTHHITGLRAYDYRAHHAAKAGQFAFKLARLKAADRSNLFIPESPSLGGFGHLIDGALVNVDTLKFYECLIALDRAGAVGCLRSSPRPKILEIGAGWGGFAYQVKTLLPHATYIIVDLPPTMLFSMTYLGATFPDAKMRIYGDVPDEALFANLDEVDFVFVPAHAFPKLPVPGADLAVNMVSFQEMTTAQVTGYVDQLADAGCRQLYSLNRDRSPYNTELSAVTEIMNTRYRVERIDVLPVPYTVLTWKTSRSVEHGPTDYRHQIGRL